MHKILARIAPIVWFGDETVRRIVYWTAFFGVAGAAMSWVAAYITPLYQYGWGAVVFAGVGAACAITLVFSGALVAWRVFNPLSLHESGDSLHFITNIVIYANAPDAPVMFSGMASNNLKRVKIFLDCSAYFITLVSAAWSQRRRIELAAFEPFEKEVRYEATVVSRIVGADGKTAALKFGNQLDNKDIIGGVEKYRARLAFIAPEKEQYFYFMLVPTCRPDGRIDVIVLNQNDFSFQQEWEET